MADMDWKAWLLTAIVAVGLLFEVFKHVPVGQSAGLWDKDRLSFVFGNPAPYSVKLSEKAQENIAQTHPLPHLPHGFAPTAPGAFAATTPQATDFEHKPKGGEGKKVAEKKKKDDDEWEYFTDPVTGKKYRRRKKKVAKTEDTAPAPVKSAPKSQDPTDPPSAVDTEVFAVGAADPVPANGATDPNDVDEWMRKLLAQPNIQATRAFIQAYQNNQVSADVFYQVVKAMLDDSRADMQQLGAMCAGQTPSVMSFQLLADADRTAPATVRKTIESYLNQYSSLSELGILKSVLTGTDSYAVAVASYRVMMAARQYLQPTAAAGGTGGGGTGTVNAQNTVAANGARFKDFLGILLSLTKSQDPTVSSYAKSAYNELQRRLASADTATPPTTTASNDDTPTPAVP